MLVYVVLEASDADLTEMCLVPGVHLRCHLKPNGVQQFQHARKADRLAVVRRG